MPNISLNPSSLVTNGAIVNSTNPLPTRPTTAAAPTTGVSLNPKTFVVDGALVTTSNPLPISLV